MARFSFKMQGMAKARSRFSALPRHFGSAIADAVKESAFIIERQSKIAISTGQTKAIDTGRLRGSIAIQELKPFRATIIPTTNYAIYVHEGTSRMRPRRFMKRGIENSKAEIERVFGNKIKIALNK